MKKLVLPEKNYFALPEATLIPERARKQLIAAAQTPCSGTDPKAREKAINTATENIKRQYPQYFKQGA